MSYQKLPQQMIGITLVFLLLVGCGAPTATPAPVPTSIPSLFPIVQNDKAGYIDASGQIVIQLQFDDARSFSEGLAAVRAGSLWGYIDATGTMVIQPQFEYADSFSEGLAAILVGSLWGYIDATGATVIQPLFEDATHFSGGRARIGINEKYGYINPTGEVVIAPDYGDASDFSEGVASVMKCTSQKPCKITSMTGAWGIFTFRTGGEWIYIDQAGDSAMSPTFDGAKSFSGGLAPAKIGESWGYIDKTGGMVVQPQFEDAHVFSEDLSAVRIDKIWGYIDRTGTLVIPPQFDWASDFSEGLAAVTIGEEHGYVDKTGAIIIRLKCLLAEDFSEGLAEVWIEDENGKNTMDYINEKGEYIWKASTTTLPPAKVTPTPELALPPIPETFPRTHEAECEWQKQILGSWSRKMEDQSTETVTFKPDNTLFFTNGDKPNQIRVGTYICEQGGTLKLSILSYVEGKPEMLLTMRKIEISFPSPDTLIMDVKPVNEVWTYERVG